MTFQVQLILFPGLFLFLFPLAVDPFLMNSRFGKTGGKAHGDDESKKEQPRNEGSFHGKDFQRAKVQLIGDLFVMITRFISKNFLMALRSAWIILLSVLLLASCKKESDQPVIPETYVNFSLNPNSTEYLELNHPGGFLTVTGGYRGIILYRLTINEFLAYDRTCPYDPWEEAARLELDETGTIATCPVCGSQYLITDGSPITGPSVYLLKQYHTMYDGSLLYVYN